MFLCFLLSSPGRGRRRLAVTAASLRLPVDLARAIIIRNTVTEISEISL